MDTVLVYRLDMKTKARITLGVLVDRRKKERGENAMGMLKLARKVFASTEEESRSIFIKYGDDGENRENR
jgi:hypothetical protein